MNQIISIVILMSGLLVGCVPTTEDRVRTEFGIGAHDAIGTNEIRAAILKLIPIGTPEGKVIEDLRRRTEADKLVTVSTADRQINCRIDYDPRSVGVVKTSYLIHFLLDDQRILKDVQIKEWLTGP
jgi:hypothetical protein